MDITSTNQLVPYSEGLRQVTPNSPRETGSVPAKGYTAAKRYVLMPPSHSPGYNVRSGDQELIYTSSRRIKVQEIYHIGSLVDIYA